MQAARVAPTATPDSTGDVSDIFKSTEDISDILSDAPASQPPPGDSGEGPRGPDGPAWDPDANHVSVADMVGTHPENHDGNIIRRPSEVRRQHQWRKGGKARQPKKASVSRRATAAVLQILPEHLTFKIDFKAMEAFRKHPDEENFGAALNNRASLATIETLAAVLSIACAIGDLEGTTEAEHLVFRSLLTVCSFVTLFCSHNALLIANVLKEKGEFFKPQLRWWLQDGSRLQIALLITKLFHIPPGVPEWVIDPKWQLWVFLRLVILGSFLREYCPTVRSKVVRTVTKLTKIRVANTLVFKWYIKVYPFRIFTATYVYLVFAFGYMVWVVERDDSHAKDEFSGHLANRGYLDYCWMIIATVTTAGYGDLYPVTGVGRMLTALAMALGVVTTSLLIHSISDFMELQTHEARILGYTMRRIVNRDQQLAAATLIQVVWRDTQLIRSGSRKTHSYRYYKALRQWRKAMMSAREINTSGPWGMDIRNIDLQYTLNEIRDEAHESKELLWKEMSILSELAGTGGQSASTGGQSRTRHGSLKNRGSVKSRAALPDPASSLHKQLSTTKNELSTTQQQLIASQQQLITAHEALAKANAALQLATSGQPA